MAEPVRVGDLGIDYSGARPHPEATRRNGARFILRYSAGVGNTDSATAWKLCGPGEIAEAVAAGLDFIANSEWTESRITEGAAAGAADGAADLKFWRSRGLAKGASIYVSWDQFPSPLKWKNSIAYLNAYDRALRGYYHVDCYAGTRFLRYALKRGVIRHGWRTNAGSWSGDRLPYQPRITPTLLGVARKRTPAAIWQTGSYWYGKQADENVILRVPVGSHLEALAAASKPTTPPPPPPAPAPEPVPVPALTASTSEDSMLIVTVDRADCARHKTRWPGVFLLSGGQLKWIPSYSDLKQLRKAGVPEVPAVSLAFYRQLGGK